jgi:hypothetical protein
VANSTPVRPGPDLRLVAAVFLVAVVTLILRAGFLWQTVPFFADTDDAMRMVMVRDFLAGQGWYDLVAHRLNTPWGAELHWSRLVDLPLAFLVVLFTPLLGAEAALLAAGSVWPMLLLALLLWVSACLAFRLVGPEGVLPAVVLPVLSPAIMAEFTPGRVDHHNVIILLTLATVWAGIEALRRPRFAIACGLFAATASAIAIEALPTIAAAILVMGLAWVFDSSRAITMRAFGLSFALFSVLHLAIFRPPARWLEPACDVISPLYVGVAMVVGAVFTLASVLPAPRTPWQRLLLLAVLALAGLALVALAYPQCLAGPYGMLDPWLQANWIAGIVEARPWFTNLFDMPAYALAVGIPVLLGVVIVLHRLWQRPANWPEWAALLVFMVLTGLVMLAQIRGARLAIMPVMPAAAWLIVAARQRYLARSGPGTIAGLLLSWLVFSGIVLSLLVTVTANLLPGRAAATAEFRTGKDMCLIPSAFADLAALPPERIMAPIDLGAHLLLHTGHEVVAAPYHRNEQGVGDTFRFFNGPIAEARTILADRAIGLVILCPSMPELRGLADRAQDSFINLYAEQNLPPWLVDVSLPNTPLQVFAVLPE